MSSPSSVNVVSLSYTFHFQTHFHITSLKQTHLAFAQHTGKPGPGTLVGPVAVPTKTRKLGPGTLEKPENRDLSETLRQPKKWDTVP